MARIEGVSASGTRRSEARLRGRPWASVSAAAMMLAIAGCDSTSRDWERAQSAATIEALREFLNLHPNSPHDALATARITELSWHAVKDTDSLAVIEAFLTDHPGSPFEEPARRTHERISWQEALAEGSIAAYRRVLGRYPRNERTPPMKVACCTDWFPPNPNETATAEGDAVPTYQSDYEHSGITQRPGPGGVGWETDWSQGPGTVKGSITSRLGATSWTARFGKVIFISGGIGLCLTEGEIVLPYSALKRATESSTVQNHFVARGLTPGAILVTLDPRKNHRLCLAMKGDGPTAPLLWEGTRIDAPAATFIRTANGWMFEPLE